MFFCALDVAQPSRGAPMTFQDEQIAKLYELEGQPVVVLSRQSGLHIGVNAAIYEDVAAGTAVWLRSHGGQGSGIRVNVLSLVAVEPLEYEPAHGDGSSHGATWQHLDDSLRSTQRALEASRGVGI